MEYPAPTPDTFAVEDAWKPLPGSFWRSEEAQHLLRRLGFSATPEAVATALRGTPKQSVEEAFRSKDAFAKSKALIEFEKGVEERYEALRRESDPEAKRERRQELRREDEALFREFAMDWFHYARRQEHSAREKFVLFLQDIFVVARTTVKETSVLFNLQQTIRSGLDLHYPELCKQISREPAMIRYLDLDKNTAKRPNENFARELFELFTLGEGNYTEADIKEASRAFTGYRVRKRTEFFFQQGLHDSGEKTVFGERGDWGGDDVIDITFKQKAARTFLIRELIDFYLTNQPIPEAYIEALGDQWAANEFRLSYLIETFFQSRLFFHPAYRGNLVKSPIHFYIGLCQDLRLDVIPFDSRVLRSMKVMGQSFYDPPNVRGWLYGEHWINSTTISGRRQLVDYLFSPLREKNLNGNESRELEQAREAGRDQFLVTEDRLRQSLGRSSRELAEHFTTYFITAQSRATYRPALESILGDTESKGASTRVRNAMIALLQSPAYNLC
jgi:uncharacterized protein (DUF1800 family)